VRNHARPIGLLRLSLLFLGLLCLGSVLLVLAGCVDKLTEHRVRANAYLKVDKAGNALKECEAGLAIEPANVALHILRGKSLFELGRLDEARQAYTKALSHGATLAPSQLTEAQLGLAIVAVRNKNWLEARKRFLALSDANPKDAHARLNLARVCLQMKDMPCAIAHAEKAGHLQGRSEEVLFTLGRIYTAAKKYDEADRTFARICEVVKAASSCPYGRAIVAAQRGDKKLAIEQLAIAVERKLPNPDRLESDPLLAPIAKEPAFLELARKATE
jgi:tetratricopeptide (TPR) repeat protein